MIHELENIFNSLSLKSEFKYILECLIDNIIADEIDVLCHYTYIRKLTIKHFYFGEVFRTNFDPNFKELMNYLNKFMVGTYEENKKN